MHETQDARAIRLQNRSELLLRAAVEAFGRYGYVGASLREIAREAGSSLTLIAHHYGNKPTLLTAAVQGLHRAGAGHLIVLRGFVDTTPVLRLPMLVEAWSNYAFALFGNRAGLPYLRLMLRLQTDPAVDAQTRQGLDASEPVVRKALKRLHPWASQAAIDLAWEVASAALYPTLLKGAEAALGVEEQAARQSAVEDFVTAGLASHLEAAGSLA